MQEKQNTSREKATPLEAIILLGHGSRVPDAGRDMEKVARRLQEKYAHPIVEICFMSRLGPHFPEIFEKCVGMGVTRVLVIPYFLHSGLHMLLDIPEMMQEEAAKYPQVELIFGKSLGFDEILVDLVEHSIQKSAGETDVRNLALPPKDKYPVPPGQHEFVPMLPEEAEQYQRKSGH